jgi:hypothetical protein
MSFAAKEAFLRWPLVHQLGFIPANAYTQLELEDGEYSPCDLLPMGIIPLQLQNIIESFAIELGNRHQQESKKDFLNQWQKVRATSLLKAISIAMAAGTYTATFKKDMISALPPHLFDVKLSLSPDDAAQTNPNLHPNDKQQAGTLRDKPKKQIITPPVPKAPQSASDKYPCMGTTCAKIFTTRSNLRPNQMPKENATCRRCINIHRAILIAQSIEQFFS